MATASLIRIEQCLASTYRPDCDYVDGKMQERSVGKFDHSNLQRAIVGTLFAREREWNIRVLPEQRVRVSVTVFAFRMYASSRVTSAENRCSPCPRSCVSRSCPRATRSGG